MITAPGNAVVFYAACYAAGFLLCFPFGAASLEILRLSLARKRRPAYFVAAGAALASTGWALLSFLGVRSIMSLIETPRFEFWVLAAAAVLFGGLSFLAFRDARRATTEEMTFSDPSLSSKRAAPLAKGVLLGLINPQTVASWVVVLSLFKKAGLRVEPVGPAWIPFSLAVFGGYGSFFVVVAHLARRVSDLWSGRSRAKLQKAVAGFFLLLALALAGSALRLAGR